MYIVPHIQLTMRTTLLFSLATTEPASDVKDPSETENTKLLPTTAVIFKSNAHEKGVGGHSPMYIRAKNLFKVEVKEIYVVL